MELQVQCISGFVCVRELLLPVAVRPLAALSCAAHCAVLVDAGEAVVGDTACCALWRLW